MATLQNNHKMFIRAIRVVNDSFKNGEYVDYDSDFNQFKDEINYWIENDIVPEKTDSNSIIIEAINWYDDGLESGIINDL